MISHIMTIGMGLFLPIGELGTIITSGKEINIKYGFPKFNVIEIKMNSFIQDNLVIDIFRFSQGINFKAYKNINIGVGTGIYYARSKSNKGFESEYGNWHYFGIIYKLSMSQDGKIYFIPSLLYSTVPQGLSLTLNISINI